MFKAFQRWLESNSAEASKIDIKISNQVGDDGERGLFALHDIFAGERIIYLPTKILLTEDWIQSQGLRVLKRIHEGCDIISFQMEELVTGMIEELRQLLEDETSMVHAFAQTVQYNWRQDDAVTLYLIATRKFSKKEDDISHEELLPIEDLSSEPILVHNVIPVSPDDCVELENEPNLAVQDEISIEQQDVPIISSFIPYVSVLPDCFPTSPLYFDLDALSRMHGTNCCEFTKRMVSQMERDWMHLSAIIRIYLSMEDRRVPSSPAEIWDSGIDFEHYKWALCCIYSRSTDFVTSQSHQRVMAPLFDMINHDFDSNVTHEMDLRGNLSVFARADIPSGSEIFLNYGNFPNEKLLLVYGFVVPDNPYDAIQVFAPIPSDSLFSKKSQILKEKFGILDPNSPHLLRRNEPIPESLLCSLRLIGLQSDQDFEAAAVATSNTFDGVFGFDNEWGALVALGNALESMRHQLDENLQLDDDLHTASELRSTEHEKVESHPDDATERSMVGIRRNQRHCRILCQSEGTILVAAQREIKSRLDALHNPEVGILSQ